MQQRVLMVRRAGCSEKLPASIAWLSLLVAHRRKLLIADTLPLR
jgi:hypothetical protein